MAKTENPFTKEPVQGPLCRVINWRHLSKDAIFHLKAWINSESVDASEVLFDVFELPDSDGFGIRLHDTPWNRSNLALKHGISLTQLVGAHRENGVPTDLTDIIKKAGEADIRIILFEADAPVLPGLKVYSLTR